MRTQRTAIGLSAVIAVVIVVALVGVVGVLSFNTSPSSTASTSSTSTQLMTTPTHASQTTASNSNASNSGGQVTTVSTLTSVTTVSCNSSPTELAITENGTTTTTTEWIPSSPCQSQITLGNFSLCVSNCNYPSPYLSGTVNVDTFYPLSTLLLYVNGTYEGSTTYSNNFQYYAIGLKANPNNPSMPITPNDTYTIKLVAIFQNGLATVASTQVVADS